MEQTPPYKPNKSPQTPCLQRERERVVSRQIVKKAAGLVKNLQAFGKKAIGKLVIGTFRKLITGYRHSSYKLKVISCELSTVDAPTRLPVRQLSNDRYTNIPISKNKRGYCPEHLNFNMGCAWLAEAQFW